MTGVETRPPAAPPSACKGCATREVVSVALVGNKNTGKSTLFNALTGSRQKVANWPGVTVERHEGQMLLDGARIRVVDLPGTYSLNPNTPEENITTCYVASGESQLVVNVVDAAGLARHLYLTLQLMELGVPVILNLNMMDDAQRRKVKINLELLSRALGVPVISTVATRGIGVAELKRAMANPPPCGAGLRLDYGVEINAAIERIEGQLVRSRCRSLAISLLENDPRTRQILLETGQTDLLKTVDEERGRLQGLLGEPVEVATARARFAFINRVLDQSVELQKADQLTPSDRLDRVLAGHWLGFLFLIFVTWLAFKFTFAIGFPLSAWIGGLIGTLGGALGNWMASAGASPWMVSLLKNGVFGGVGAVLSLLPYLFTFFLAMAFLEDSGYLVRAAFLMDSSMSRLGLNGRAFIPMALGFGCNVPAIMATRMLDDRKDRLATILSIPLTACTARLVVFTMFVGTFFKSDRAEVLLSLYLLSIGITVLSGFLFKTKMLRGGPTPVLLEFPPYRMPTFKNLWHYTWNHGRKFLEGAGTLIFSVSVVIWLFASLPVGTEYGAATSWIGRFGGAISLVFKPMGFGFWQASVALVFGFLAKEVVIGTFGSVYHVGQEGLAVALLATFTPLSAYAFLVFVLLYTPCLATLIMIKSETRQFRWVAVSVGYGLVVAWLLSFGVYQVGRLLGYS